MTLDGSVHPYPSRLVALDGTAEELAEHLGCNLHDCKARAQLRIAHADHDVTPAELVLEG